MAHSKVLHNPRTKPLIRLMDKLIRRHSTWEIFCDFVELMALSISLCSPVGAEEHAKQIDKIKSRYTADELSLMAELITAFGEQMESCFDGKHLEDILVQLYEELDLNNERNGQFFTPQCVADFMGQVTFGSEQDRLLDAASDRGYITVCEPCVGGGAMLYGFANALDHAGLDHRTQMVVTAVDIDLRCVQMAYIQLSLYGIPAVVIHGNTLTAEEWSRWYTPVYVLDNWVWRQRCGITDGPKRDDELLKMATEPMYAAIHMMEHWMQKEATPSTMTEPDITLNELENGQVTLF